MIPQLAQISTGLAQFLIVSLCGLAGTSIAALVWALKYSIKQQRITVDQFTLIMENHIVTETRAMTELADSIEENTKVVREMIKEVRKFNGNNSITNRPLEK